MYLLAIIILVTSIINASQYEDFCKNTNGTLILGNPITFLTESPFNAIAAITQKSNTQEYELYNISNTGSSEKFNFFDCSSFLYMSLEHGFLGLTADKLYIIAEGIIIGTPSVTITDPSIASISFSNSAMVFTPVYSVYITGIAQVTYSNELTPQTAFIIARYTIDTQLDNFLVPDTTFKNGTNYVTLETTPNIDTDSPQIISLLVLNDSQLILQTSHRLINFSATNPSLTPISLPSTTHTDSPLTRPIKIVPHSDQLSFFHIHTDNNQAILSNYDAATLQPTSFSSTVISESLETTIPTNLAIQSNNLYITTSTINTNSSLPFKATSLQSCSTSSNNAQLHRINTVKQESNQPFLLITRETSPSYFLGINNSIKKLNKTTLESVLAKNTVPFLSGLLSTITLI